MLLLLELMINVVYLSLVHFFYNLHIHHLYYHLYIIIHIIDSVVDILYFVFLAFILPYFTILLAINIINLLRFEWVHNNC
jgi:hypothetical protein